MSLFLNYLKSSNLDSLDAVLTEYDLSKKHDKKAHFLLYFG